jgi:dimethylamine monooxygenase subunit A
MDTSDKLAKFPYPFKEDVYRYSNNSVLLETPNSIEVTDSYHEEIKLKRKLLSEQPNRCYQSLPHTLKGQWEVVELVIDNLVTYYPDLFFVEKKGKNWTIHNSVLNETESFVFGEKSTLPIEPLDFIGRHVQEDLILMGQRDGDLFLDAGQLCFPANWSLAFNVGMNYKEIHRPIPGFKEVGLDDRILTFMMRMEAGSPWWRKNWSLMAGDTLDTSLETFHEWGQNRKKVTKENAGDFVHLRVEVQKLFRLPRTDFILFTIHTHLLPLSKLASKREWLEQFYHILKELPEHIVEYKGLALFKDEVIEYLREKLKGEEQ